MKVDETFKLAETTPSLESIENYGTPKSDPETDRGIKEEADRRFRATLSYIGASEFLWRKNPEQNRDYEDETVWDPQTHRYQDIRFPDTRIQATKLYDPEVLDFVKQAVALRLFANSQLDDYVVTKGDFSIKPDDEVFVAISGNYDVAVRGLHQKMIGTDTYESEKQRLYAQYGFSEEDVKDYRNLQDDQGEESSEDYGFTERDMAVLAKLDAELDSLDYNHSQLLRWDGYLEDIKLDDYLDLVERIASACASNAYLERLFQIYARPEDKLKIGVLYKEKLLKMARDEGMLVEPEHELLIREQAFRAKLLEWYGGLGNVDIQPTVYVSRGSADKWERLVLGEYGVNDRREGFYYDEVKCARSSIALGLTVAYIYPGRSVVDQAEVLFEELYHASKGGFTAEQKAVWSKAGSLFEEGLAKLEVRSYLSATEGRQGMVAEGTRRSNRAKAKRGEQVAGDTTILEHSAGAFMLLLSRELGEDGFVGHLRAARAGNAMELEKVATMIDQRFGDGTYDELCQTGGYQVRRVNRLAQKMGLIESPADSPVIGGHGQRGAIYSTDRKK